LKHSGYGNVCKVSAEAFNTFTSRAEKLFFERLEIQVYLFKNLKVRSITLKECDLDPIGLIYVLSKIEQFEIDNHGTFDSL